MSSGPRSNSPKPLNRLRYPLYESNGMLLLSAGSELTPRLQGLLDRRGINLKLDVSLVVVHGKPLNLEIPVGPRLTIGRKPDCEVRPDSGIVSGYHCRIFNRPMGVYLVDLNSTNGTFLNGERVTGEVEMGDGDLLQVGQMVFRLQIYAAVAADNQEDQEALDEWVLAEPFSGSMPSQVCTGSTQRIDLEEVLRKMKENQPQSQS